MSSNNVVLVLGAGASHFLDFPTGSELVAKIKLFLVKTSDAWNQDEEHRNVTKSICESDTHSVVKSAIKIRTLMDSKHISSIDNFIGTPQVKEIEYGQDILKSAIAHVISKAEYISKNKMTCNNLLLPKQTDDDWYAYFCKYIIDHYSGNLQVINFNYDRSFDVTLKRHFITSHTSHAYINNSIQDGPLESAKSDVFDEFKIYHPYGSLGAISDLPYGIELTTDHYKNVIQRIAVIDIERDQTNFVFERCSQILDEASKVVFIGFGFNKTNMERLGFGSRKNNPAYYFTSVGVAEAEFEAISKSLKMNNTFANYKVTKKHECKSIIDFLRSTGCLNV